MKPRADSLLFDLHIFAQTLPLPGMLTRRVIQIPCLGHMGRFGNQLFQYCFAKAYALKHRAALEVPHDWIGRQLFKIPEPSPSVRLQQTEIDRIPWGKVNVALVGLFQFQEALDIYTRTQARAWLVPQDRWKARWEQRPRAHYACAHRRMGDYLALADRFCNILPEAYIQACREFDIDEKELVWVTEDTQRPDPELDTVNCGFLNDFAIIKNADVILRCNSTFSWWAAALGTGKVYSPIVEDKIGFHMVPFIEGNHPRLIDMRFHGPMVKHSELRLKD